MVHQGDSPEGKGLYHINAVDEVTQWEIVEQWLTPLEKLLSLDQPEQYLRQGRSLPALERHAGTLSDTEAALRLQRARDHMFADLERVA